MMYTHQKRRKTMEFQLSKITLSSVYLVLFLTLPNLPLNVASDSTAEANALLRWKASLHSKTNPLLSSWPANKTSPCDWIGVSCSDARKVTGIDLASSGLIGTLQKFPFSSFPNLLYFNLSMNELFGSIPPELSQLYKLIYLDLSTNRFSGKIPSSIGLLTHLEVLNLSENELSGSIPQELGQLESLNKLSLHNNNLHGHIPSSFGNLTNLTHLYLYNNPLSGSIPLELNRRLYERSYHDLWNNQYSDKIRGPSGKRPGGPP
ncbi:probable leucine-rich repeat receptor-like protein kinase At1g35710 [Tripterygium wilfordii]|uniref:probable leucine-rich repeat receptor-like protein kinase At1g35710 n=1 Tax=Tripterygium wilfordii TaxID=458696 RepID=UPI0018F84341|nr:probable leucine-rich repeat receptor-like protein kinase At1g35710 [Tripterygium wilfordii]